MDSYPYRQTNYVDLLTSQQGSFSFDEDSVQVSSSQVPLFATEALTCPQDPPAERKEPRRMWMPVEDIVLISGWLNTSKDPVVANEQRQGAFWKRIAAYFAASPKIAAGAHRSEGNCKQRWHKINDQVNKFCGAFEAATRGKTSGQNENDVLNKAHEKFFNLYGKKFLLEHAWKELRYDQKWCAVPTDKGAGSSKKRKLDDGSASESSPALDTMNVEERPPGVKAAKAKLKKKNVDLKETLSKFEGMWEIKQKDLVSKERVTTKRLLESLLAKKEALDESEVALKKKLIDELLLN